VDARVGARRQEARPTSPPASPTSSPTSKTDAGQTEWSLEASLKQSGFAARQARRVVRDSPRIEGRPKGLERLAPFRSTSLRHRFNQYADHQSWVQNDSGPEGKRDQLQKGHENLRTSGHRSLPSLFDASLTKNPGNSLELSRDSISRLNSTAHSDDFVSRAGFNRQPEWRGFAIEVSPKTGNELRANPRQRSFRVFNPRQRLVPGLFVPTRANDSFRVFFQRVVPGQPAAVHGHERLGPQRLLRARAADARGRDRVSECSNAKMIVV
jgi:hypothetical protein